MPNAVRGAEPMPFACRSGRSATGRFPPPSRDRLPSLGRRCSLPAPRRLPCGQRGRRRGRDGPRRSPAGSRRVCLRVRHCPRSGRGERALPRPGAWAVLELGTRRITPGTAVAVSAGSAAGSRTGTGPGDGCSGPAPAAGAGSSSRSVTCRSTSAVTSPRRSGRGKELMPATAARPRAGTAGPTRRILMQHSGAWAPEPFGSLPGISPRRLRSLAVCCRGAGEIRRRRSEPASVRGRTVEDGRKRAPGCIVTSSGST